MLASYSYPFSAEPNGEGGFMASFRDVPEALTEAHTLEDLQAMALDALITAMEFYVKDRRKLPAPSSPLDGEMVVMLPPSVVSKVLLLNIMIENHIRPSELAKRMGITRQEVNRLIDLHHSTKIDTVGKAFEAMGKQLELSVR